MKEFSDTTDITQMTVHNCVFCDNDFSMEQYPILLNKAMFVKYQKKQLNQSKAAIDQMLTSKSPALVHLIDQIQLHDDSSYLKAYYSSQQ